MKVTAADPGTEFPHGNAPGPSPDPALAATLVQIGYLPEDAPLFTGDPDLAAALSGEMARAGRGRA
jgi:hypothetical protein